MATVKTSGFEKGNCLRCLIASATLLFAAGTANAATYRVTPDAAGGGDGQSWATSMTIAEAVAAATTADDMILCMAGTYTPTANITISKPIIVKGGLAGTDDSTLDATSPMSVFDTANDTAVTAIFSVTTSTGGNTTNLFERIEVRNAYERGFLKTGNASLVFRNCAFTACGTTRASNYNGRGGSFTGNSAAILAFENCTFARNAFSASAQQLGYGFGAYIATWKQVYIDNTLFVSNGLSSACVYGGYNGSGRDSNFGAAFYATGAPMTIRNSDFRANIAGVSGSQRGGIAYLAGNCNGSIIKNCIFAGNACEWCHNNGFTSSDRCGVVVFAADNSARTLDVENCTFAYNLIDGTYGTAGIDASKGTLTVRNTIFYGAKGGQSRACGKDIHVYADATADIDYCLFESNSSDCFSAAKASALTMGEHNVFGDPLFATPLSAVSSYYISLRDRSTSFYFTGYSLAAFDAVLSTIDVHVSNTALAYSRAIDTGTGDGSGEPAPNGGISNLGAYGNTAEASTSTCLGLPSLSSSDIAVTFADDTHPTVSCVPGGATPYNAHVKFEISSEDLSQGGTVAESFGLGGIQNGDTATFTGKGYYTPGDTLYVRVTVSAPGQSALVVHGSAIVTGTLPDFVGHGGGASVIHVRGGAAGLGDGSDWANAFDNVNEAMACAAANASKSEIWIAGTLVARATADQVTLTSTPLAIRGGFTGTEDSIADRAPGVYSTIDGADNNYKSFNFKNTALVSFERLVFTHARLSVQSDKGGHIFKDSSAGDVILSDCRFVDNVAAGNNSNYGLAGCFQGTAAATVSITNCVFAYNRADGNASAGSINGRVLYAQTLKRLVIDDTLFVSNGCNLVNNPLNPIGGRDWGKGGVIYVNGAPLTMRGCELRANRSPIRGNTGGIVLLENASYPSAFTNCLFVGNENTYGETGKDYADATGGNNNPRGGTILVDYNSADDVCDLKNCTVAYNISDAKYCGAGVQVVKGKLTARDTIIYGNKVGPTSFAYGDIQLWDDGSAELDYVRLTSEQTFGESSGGAVVSTKTRYTLDNVTYGDPVFATPLADFESIVKTATYSSSGYTFQYQYFDNTAAGIASRLALDAHLCSPAGMFDNSGALVTTETRYSNAIDAGDPESDFTNEPDPNGGRVNLGAYGNTPKASMTTGGQPEISDVSITYPDDYTAAQIAVTVGGTGSFIATVTLSIGGETVGTVTDVLRGGTATFYTQYFDPEETYQWTVSVSADDSETRSQTDSATVPAGNTVPPWANHGGDPTRVIHVWNRGTASGDGSNWGRSVNTFAEALALLTSTRNEIWLHAGENVLPASLSLAAAHPVVIRGGFTGMEDTADERTFAEGLSIQDAIQDAATTNEIVLTVNNASALTLDGFVFQNGIQRGFSKSGAGDIALVGCKFLNNGPNWPNTQAYNVYADGRGAMVSGVAASTVAAFTNCVFEGNVSTAELANHTGRGMALYAQFLKSLVIDSTLFLTNGAAPSCRMGTDSCGRDDFHASTIYSDGVPVTATNCRFIGNRATCRYTDDPRGGCVVLAGACGGSSFENCLFAGNYENYGWNAFANDGNGSGALVVSLSAADATVAVNHCTFAYNLAMNQSSGAGLTVRSGTANISNSIFFGNVKATTSIDAAGADLTVLSGATANVSYSLFTTNGTASYGSADTTGWTGCIFGDPLFVTDAETAAGWITTSGSTDVLKDINCRYSIEALSEIVAVNCHLRSRRGYTDETTGLFVKPAVGESMAIDAADPVAPYKGEPSGYNGRRANMGFYGNTPWATRSVGSGIMVIVR